MFMKFSKLQTTMANHTVFVNMAAADECLIYIPYIQRLIHCLIPIQVDSPLNLKHPHDVVIFMRQETRVNYLKTLEVCGFLF